MLSSAEPDGDLRTVTDARGSLDLGPNVLHDHPTPEPPNAGAPPDGASGKDDSRLPKRW
ncbi:hypothetical protein [Haladaptatus salinisoli]|uniref:hypothetical protein n=1 Tax=Haladaptatus salinisoli TaxID=2884876 RepID=UPI001D0A7282|nr:hypothetical protein [Haladaptatus salinisoli]